MPRLMIDLSGVEYDRLCEMARRERRTPNAQAAVVIGTTMEALARHGDLTDPLEEATHDNPTYHVPREKAAPPEGGEAEEEALAREREERTRWTGNTTG